MNFKKTTNATTNQTTTNKTNPVENFTEEFSNNLKEDLSNYATQINPLRGFTEIAFGISTDIKNIATELDLKPINFGDDKSSYLAVSLNNKEDKEKLNKALEEKQDIALAQEDGKKFLVLGVNQNAIIDETSAKEAKDQEAKNNKVKPTDIPQDKRIYITSNEYSLEQIKENPNLINSFSLSSNGILNNQNEAIRNATMQLNGFDDNGQLMVLYDPSKKGNKTDASLIDLGFDLFEVNQNFLGATLLGGMVRTNVAAQNQEFMDIASNKAKDEGQKITLSGHSGGGLRNYQVLLNSNPNQFIDSKGNSMLNMMSYGSPTNNVNYNIAANNAGATYHNSSNNSGDFVGYALGGNGDVLDVGNALGHVLHLAEVKIDPNFSKIKSNPIGIFKNPKEYFDNLKSPHSNYYCVGITCNNQTNP